MSDFFKNVGDYFAKFGYLLLLCLVVFIAGFSLTWLLCFLLKKLLYKTKIDGAMVSFITSIIKIIVLVLLIIICAGILELPTGGLLVSLGTFAVAIGLTLKDSLSDIANGMLIIFNKPFRRGI